MGGGDRTKPVVRGDWRNKEIAGCETGNINNFKLLTIISGACSYTLECVLLLLIQAQMLPYPPSSSSSLASCSICIDRLKTPIALPCGHVYCLECILKTVQQVTPHTTLHHCPTCRSPFSTVSIDPAFVPAHLRQYITPGIRKLFMEDPIEPLWPGASSGALPDKELARILAENASLRTNCALWQRRAEVQAAASIGLIGLARYARDRAVQFKAERDQIKCWYDALRRKYEPESMHCEEESSKLGCAPASPSLDVPQPSLASEYQGQSVASLLASVSSLEEHLRPSSPLDLSLISLPPASSQPECPDDILHAQPTHSSSVSAPASHSSVPGNDYPSTHPATTTPRRGARSQAQSIDSPSLPSPCRAASPSPSPTRRSRPRSPRPNISRPTADSLSGASAAVNHSPSTSDEGLSYSHSDSDSKHSGRRTVKRRRLNEDMHGHAREHVHASPESMSPDSKRRKIRSPCQGSIGTPSPRASPLPTGNGLEANNKSLSPKTFVPEFRVQPEPPNRPGQTLDHRHHISLRL